jgi:oligosaccharide repeat unit polymerase
MNLIVLTLLLGVPSTLASVLLLQRLFTALFWYWFAWLVALISAEISAQLGFLPTIGPLAQQIIIDAHIGAFVGFIVALAVASLMLTKRQPQQNNRPRFVFSQRLLKHLSLFFLAVAVIHLVYRVSLVGDVGGVLFFQIRQDFLALRDPLRITQFSSIIFTLVLPIFALLGAEDHEQGDVRLKRLFPLYLAGLIHGIAMGGRIWLLMPVLYYIFSYLLLSDVRDRSSQRILFKRLRLITLTVIILFVALGGMKSVDSSTRAASEHWYQNPSGILSPMVYAGVALASLDATAWNATQIRPLHGQLLFSWFAERLNSLGLLNNHMTQEEVVRRDLVYLVDWRVAATQCTVLCLAVGDFGLSNVVLAMAILMGLCQLASTGWQGQGYMRQILATIAVMAAFMTVQDTWFGIPVNAVGIILTIPLIWLIGKYNKKDVLLDRRTKLRERIGTPLSGLVPQRPSDVARQG